MKSNSNAKPVAFLPLGNGSYHYNHNVQQVEVPAQEGQPKSRKAAAVAYDYEVARFWGAPTYETVVKAVVREKYSESQEFALINAYNAFVLGISTDPADKTEYEAYLAELVAIKSMVKQDLADYEAAK